MIKVDLYDVLAIPSNDIDGLHVIMQALHEKFFDRPENSGLSSNDSEDLRSAYGLCLDILKGHRKYLDDLLVNGIEITENGNINHMKQEAQTNEH